MATYDLNPVFTTKDTAVLWGSGQVTAAADIVNIKPVATAVDGNGVGTAAAKPLKGRYLSLVVVGAGATATLTVAKGVQGQTPANLAEGQSDLVLTVASGATAYVQLELAKYLQSDGSVKVTVTGASATPTLRAVQLSKAA